MSSLNRFPEKKCEPLISYKLAKSSTLRSPFIGIIDASDIIIVYYNYYVHDTQSLTSRNEDGTADDYEQKRHSFQWLHDLATLRRLYRLI